MKYEHLIGRAFDWEKANCYELLRSVYRDCWGIELTPYVCPSDFSSQDLDLFNKLSFHEGFRLLDCHPREYREGDVVVHAIGSSSGNHCSVIVPGGQLFTVMVGGLATPYPFAGLLRNTAVAVYRHVDVPPPEEVETDLAALLPESVLRRLGDRVR